MPEIDSQTRVALGDYLAGSLDIDDLRRRLARLAWALKNNAVTEANPITASAALFVAEFEAGHRDESDLRELFAGLLGTILTQASTSVIYISFPTVRHPGRSRPLVAAGTGA